MKKFEYEVLTIKFGVFDKRKFAEDELNKQLNEMGKDGWELVTSIKAQYGGSTNEVSLIFKREL